MTSSVASTSSVELAQPASVLAQLERARGPSCAAWTRELFELVRREHASERGDELLACARACELDASAAGPLSAEAAARTFERADLGALLALASERAPACFVGLAHEIAWLLRGDRDCGERAVRAWMTLANHATASFACVAIRARALRRATRIALALGPANSAADLVDATAARHIDDANIALDARLVLAALDARERFGRGDPERCATVAIERAEREVRAQRDHRACALYRLAARALTRAERPREAQVLVAVGASVIAHVARRRRARGEPHWIVASFLLLALEELGQAPAAPEFRVQIERELGELDSARANVEVARAWNACAEALDSTAPRERLDFIARLPLAPISPTGASWLEPLRRTLAERRSRDGRAAAWVDFANVCAASLLECARAQLALDAEATLAALDAALARDRWLTVERAELWRRGLRACIEGDCVLGLALAVPQLDHALRGERGSTLDPGTRTAAQLLLYDRSGWDLHEQVAHGALQRRELSQPTANLVLWIALRVLDHAAWRTNAASARSNAVACAS